MLLHLLTSVVGPSHRKTLFGFRVSSDVREFALRYKGYAVAVNTRMEQIRGQSSVSSKSSQRTAVGN